MINQCPERLQPFIQDWETKLEAGYSIPQIIYDIESEAGKRIAVILLIEEASETAEGRLKIAIINTACNECGLNSERLLFYTWLINALRLKNV